MLGRIEYSSGHRKENGSHEASYVTQATKIRIGATGDPPARRLSSTGSLASACLSASNLPTSTPTSPISNHIFPHRQTPPNPPPPFPHLNPFRTANRTAIGLTHAASSSAKVNPTNSPSTLLSLATILQAPIHSPFTFACGHSTLHTTQRTCQSHVSVSTY